MLPFDNLNPAATCQLQVSIYHYHTTQDDWAICIWVSIHPADSVEVVLEFCFLLDGQSIC